MEESVRQAILTLAEKSGVDADMLLAAFSSGDMPDELQQAVTAVLGDVDLFDRAVKEKDD